MVLASVHIRVPRDRLGPVPLTVQVAIAVIGQYDKQ
jgi:hypothetical protein